ncbi:MAG: dephospho-CoA kinase [Acidimicrobiales bacterium]
MLLVGLTGGIGSGKSTVAKALAERGAVVIDADRIAREIVEPEGPAYQPVLQRFGPGVVGPDGRLDRSALAARVFGNPEELAALNRLTHPVIGRAMMERVGAHAGSDRIVVLEVPLLTPESAAAYGLAGVIVVDTSEDIAVRRLVERRGLTEADARARIAAQAGREERRRLASIVVDNDGDRVALDAEMDRLWAWLAAGAPPRDDA